MPGTRILQVALPSCRRLGRLDGVVCTWHPTALVCATVGWVVEQVCLTSLLSWFPPVNNDCDMQPTCGVVVDMQGTSQHGTGGRVAAAFVCHDDEFVSVE